MVATITALTGDFARSCSRIDSAKLDRQDFNGTAFRFDCA